MRLIMYDPLDPYTLLDPYPLFASLRRCTPVFWHEGMQSWVLTRYADCVFVLRDHQMFARDRRRIGMTVPSESLSVQSVDPPDQARVRSLFMNALKAQDLEAVERRAQAFLGARLDELGERSQFDGMADLAAPLSLAVVSDLLGVEQPDVSTFSAVSDTIMRSMDAGLDPTLAEPGRLARQQLNALVESWFRASSRPGLLAHVREHARRQGSELDLYVRNSARVMFQGGYSTMVAAIGNVMNTLVQHPGALSLMRDPGVLRSGVEELVRFDGPVQGTSRIAMSPVKIGDVVVGAGETVLTLLAAANRDPDRFTDPDGLRLERADGRHLGYGWGTHACIGAVPAQLALRVLIRGLGQFPNSLRAIGSARRRRTATMRTFEVFPATFKP
jgi:cytochrome P450